MSQFTHFQSVGEFHTAAGYPVRALPYLDVFEEDKDLLRQRVDFMLEEAKEFMEAFGQDNRVEMADALCDLAYFGHGTGQCLGINLGLVDRCSQTGAIRNLSMVDGEEYLAGLENSPKYDYYLIMKDMTSIFRDLKMLSLCIENKDSVSDILDPSDYHSQFEHEYINSLSEFELFSGLLKNVMRTTYFLGYRMGFNMDVLFREVHSCNMSKFCETREDAEQSVRRYIEEGRYKEPVVREVDSDGKTIYVVFDNDRMKILKSYKWREPDLSKFM